MCVGASNQLSVEPMMDLFQEAVAETWTAADSIIQAISRFSSFLFTLTLTLRACVSLFLLFFIICLFSMAVVTFEN